MLDAVEHLERRWSKELEGVEFAVEDVPPVPPGPPETIVYDADVLEDGYVPLARLIPAGKDAREGGDNASPPRVVVYRRPLEARSTDRGELADLVHDVVVEQVAHLLNLDPDDVDPLDE